MLSLALRAIAGPLKQSFGPTKVRLRRKEAAKTTIEGIKEIYLGKASPMIKPGTGPRTCLLMHDEIKIP